MDLSVSLFGTPTVEHAGTMRTLVCERRTQLVVFLALRRTWVGRAELAPLLWPDQPAKLAYTNLRKALFRLQPLAWSAAVEANGNALCFDVPTDVVAFEAALREGRFADAVALRRGELLAGFDDPGNDAWTGWLGFERERLRVAWRGAAQALLSGDMDGQAGIDLAARLLDDDPLDENALGVYMTWLARSGQGHRAREAYRAFAERLAAELGLEPGAELKALHESIGAAPLRVVPAAAPAAPPDDGFVGRAVELRRLSALLADPSCRLLTVLGPGGVGKTRLARRAVAEMGSSFADGGVFIPLDDITTPSELGARLAHELGVKPMGGADPLDAVLDHLRERQALLVLDNFEQLVDDAPALERVLARCPAVKFIVTSRVRLALAREWLFPLDGLPCPEDEDHDRLEAFDAARLFLRAARRVAPALVPRAEAPAIVDICRHVEGLPLALELAAAWTRVMSCEAIAAELRQGTELLRAVDASHPARHSSVEFVFEQSWRLLTSAERQALARLSVFRGGFTLEAARAVAAVPLPVLAALVDKSLLRRDDSRLGLHPLVQQFAAVRLADDAELEATQAAHAAYFLRLLTQLRTAIAAGDRAALQAVDADFENCRRAWLRAIAQPKSDEARRSAKALLDFCDVRGRFAESLTLFSAAADSALAASDPAFRAQTRSQLAHVLYRLDRYDEARAMARTALREAGKGERETRRQALTVQATCALRRGRLAEARSLFQKVLDVTIPETHAATLAATLDHLALVEKGMGNFDEALRLGLQALAQHRNLGKPAAEALCLSNLGSLHLARHEDAAAMEYLNAGLAICEREGFVQTSQYILSNLTEASLNVGDLAAAERYARRTLESALASDHRALVGAARFNLARLAAKRGDLGAARAGLGEGTGVVLPLGIPILKFEALVCFAEILQAQGLADRARQVLRFAAEHPAATPGVRTQLRALLEDARDRDGERDDAGGWPTLGLDELLQRIVAEGAVAYASLLGASRDSPQTA